MAKTISVDSGSIVLSSANPGDNPLSILNGITVSGSVYGIQGDTSQAWTVTNQGTVIGTSGAGVALGPGAAVTNSGTASDITGGTYGVFANDSAATITNEGAISGTSYDGVYIGAGGTVTNSGTAANIAGGKYGVYAIGGAATVTNAGTMAGTSGAGVALEAGGTVTNSGVAADIFGGAYGVFAVGSTAIVTNEGTISGTGTAGTGVALGAGGAVTNSGTAANIAGAQYGVFASDAAATITNQGTIAGTSDAGVVLLAGGMVTNSGTAAIISGETYGVWARNDAATVTNLGTIAGTSADGVYLAAGGTLTNSGGIAGGNDAVLFAAGFTGRLVVGPGGYFSGTVDGGNTIGATDASTLELASSGTLSGVGTQFINFGSIDFDANAAWLIQGNTSGLAAGQIIDGFTLGNTIELTGFVETGHSVTNAGLVLEGAGGPQTIAFQGTFDVNSFDVTNDGTNSFVELACFAAGTRISTARGDIAVEALQPGETVQTLLRDTTAPIVWIGQRTLDCTRHPNPRQVWPVRIRAGAFGSMRPCRDLFLSPDHAIHVDGVLIPVKHLIDGTSITQVPTDTVTYYHIELPRHDVLLAEGLPTESYLDTGDRTNFANAPGPTTLHPDFASRRWEAEACAPLIVTGTKLNAVRRQLTMLTTRTCATTQQDAPTPRPRRA